MPELAAVCNFHLDPPFAERSLNVAMGKPGNNKLDEFIVEFPKLLKSPRVGSSGETLL